MSDHPEMGSGRVEYHADRPTIHFATPQRVVDATLAVDRLKRRGFILTPQGEIR
jgi:hypothetical protein